MSRATGWKSLEEGDRVIERNLLVGARTLGLALLIAALAAGGFWAGRAHAQFSCSLGCTDDWPLVYDGSSGWTYAVLGVPVYGNGTGTVLPFCVGSTYATADYYSGGSSKCSSGGSTTYYEEGQGNLVKQGSTTITRCQSCS